MYLIFPNKTSVGVLEGTLGQSAFGSVYLLVNRDIRKAYPILWIMFAL